MPDRRRKRPRDPAQLAKLYDRYADMTPKRLAEFWFTQFTLTGIKPVWWKQIYIYIVFKISPPHHH
jgi:hypothetical protein